MEAPEALLKDRQVSDWLKIPLRRLRRMALSGELPGVVVLGPRSRRFEARALQAWIERGGLGDQEAAR